MSVASRHSISNLQQVSSLNLMNKLPYSNTSPMNFGRFRRQRRVVRLPASGFHFGPRGSLSELATVKTRFQQNPQLARHHQSQPFRTQARAISLQNSRAVYCEQEL